MNLTRVEVISIAGILFSVISTVATVSTVRKKMLRYSLLGVLSIVLLASIVGLWRETHAEQEIIVKFVHHENGKRLYTEHRYVDAVAEFNAARRTELGQMSHPLAVESSYYLGSSSLRLSTPDCDGVIRLIAEMYPDPDGLANQLIQECKRVGCTNCEAIDPWSR